MAEFKEELVINVLHTDKAEIGKKYWYADELLTLKEYVEKETTEDVGIFLKCICSSIMPFLIRRVNEKDGAYKLLYPYEEPPKHRMTYGQLSEWLARGNGQMQSSKQGTMWTYLTISSEINMDTEIEEDYLIRPWDSDEWVEPTYKIYLIDCKHLSQDDIDDVAWRDGC